MRRGFETGIEGLYGAHFNGPPHTDTRSDQGFQFAGRTTIASGDSSAFVGTTRVQSSMLILATARTAVASLGPVRVSSINPAVGFTLATPVAVTEPVTVMWFSLVGVPFARKPF